MAWHLNTVTTLLLHVPASVLAVRIALHYWRTENIFIVTDECSELISSASPNGALCYFLVTSTRWSARYIYS